MSEIDIVNVLKTSWEIVRDNAPVVNATSDQANAVPAGSNWTTDLADARGPNYYTFSYVVEHPLFGFEHARVRMRLYWNYGARYRGGGAFIPNCWLDVLDCNVGIGWTVNISLNVHHPENRGTAGAPNSYLPVSVRAQGHSISSNIIETWTFGVYGAGNGEMYSS